MNIEKNVPLKDKNWFRTGGSAAYFCEPATVQEFKQALDYAKEHNLEVTMLGLGANVLISDDGIDGLVIRPAMKEIEVVEQHDEYSDIKTGAGVTIYQLIEYCLSHNLVGFERFSAIPGTVGGSMYNNLHYYKVSLSDFVIAGEVIHKQTGEIKKVNKEWFGFGYDHSKLHDHDYFLMSATFRFKKGSDADVANARARRVEIVRDRVKRYPTARTCGCFFKNLCADQITLELNGKKMVSSGYYLDKLGCKGALSVGGAMVSPQHANMIVTKEGATSADIVVLARKMQQCLKDEVGVVPQPECILLGFKEYPLLR